MSAQILFERVENKLWREIAMFYLCFTQIKKQLLNFFVTA